jgi:hypothetical protein
MRAICAPAKRATPVASARVPHRGTLQPAAENRPRAWSRSRRRTATPTRCRCGARSGSRALTSTPGQRGVGLLLAEDGTPVRLRGFTSPTATSTSSPHALATWPGRTPSRARLDARSRREFCLAPTGLDSGRTTKRRCQAVYPGEVASSGLGCSRSRRGVDFCHAPHPASPGEVMKSPSGLPKFTFPPVGPVANLNVMDRCPRRWQK